MKHIGFKAFDINLQCRGYQYEVGGTYKHAGVTKLCSTGFHFCKRLEDVFNYYPRDPKQTRLCEVVSEDIKIEGDKCVTNIITIVREIDWKEINSGSGNSGSGNSGNCNSGNRNSGSRNSGNGNSGNRNSGDWNIGYYNSGNYNSGNYNSGNYNSGNYNSGNYNSGNGNSGNWNSGYSNSGNCNSGSGNSGAFNTLEPGLRLFNKETNLKFNDSKIQRILSLNVKPILQWVYTNDMTSEEKKEHSSHITTGGFLRKTGRNDYSKLTEEDKKHILSLPGYDDKVFKEITGVSLLNKEDE